MTRAVVRGSGLMRIVRFLVIGGLSTGLYFGLLILLRDAIASTIVLTAICYAASMIVNFMAQARLTFRVAGSSSKSIRRYIIMQLTALTANSLLMAVLVDMAGMHLVAAQIIISTCLAFFTYVLSARWVYPSKL